MSEPEFAGELSGKCLQLMQGGVQEPALQVSPEWLWCLELHVQSRWECRWRRPLIMWKWPWRAWFPQERGKRVPEEHLFQNQLMPWKDRNTAITKDLTCPAAEPPGSNLQFRTTTPFPTTLIPYGRVGPRACFKKSVWFWHRWSVNCPLNKCWIIPKTFVNPRNYKMRMFSMCPGETYHGCSVQSLKRIHKLSKVYKSLSRRKVCKTEWGQCCSRSTEEQ